MSATHDKLAEGGVANDRKLLELAATAAGYELYAVWGPFGHFEGFRIGSLNGDTWDALTDDGDALRLAVKLHMSIDHNHPAEQEAYVSVTECDKFGGLMEDVDGEDYRAAATRRAIVRAAAAIASASPTAPEAQKETP